MKMYILAKLNDELGGNTDVISLSLYVLPKCECQRFFCNCYN